MFSGCASIVNGNNQVVSVETRNKGEVVAGATCQMNNGKGTYYVTTPGTVTISRAYDDMSVKCEKTNLQPGLATVKSGTKAMAFGNIIFGGIIGAGVDMATGSAYDYPSLITVMMGESNLIQPVTTESPSPTHDNAGTPPINVAAAAVTEAAKPASPATVATVKAAPAAPAPSIPALPSPSIGDDQRTTLAKAQKQ